MSHRKAQIESALKRAVSRILQEDMADPRVMGMVSVTKVEVTQDLSEAFVFVSVLPDTLAKKTVAGLVHAQGFVQGRLDKFVVLHHPPRIQFRLDEAFIKNNKALARLAQLKSQQEKNDSPSQPDQEPQDK